MKKNKHMLTWVITLLLFTLTSLNPAYANNIKANDQDTKKVKEVINEYFQAQLDSVKSKNISLIEKSNSIIDVTTESGKEIYDYEFGKAKYLITSYKLDNTTLENYNYEINYTAIEFNNNEAVVDLSITKNMKYNFLKDNFSTNESHKITLKKDYPKWLINNDEYDTDFKSLYPIGTDFNVLINDLPEFYNNYIKAVNDSKTKYNSNEDITNQIISPMSIPGDHDDYYYYSNRQNAVSYALSYTEETNDFTWDTYNNAQFKHYYDQYGEPADCQNFVSQCIWRGFGSSTSSSATKDYPMNSQWWANLSGETSTWNWTSAGTFKNYIISNENSNSYGIHGGEFIIPNDTQIGDYIYVPGHVLFVTRATDSNGNGIIDYSEIYISAHTANRRDYNLKANYLGIIPQGTRFMKIYSYKWNDGLGY